jgi:hypothetical protein
VLLNHALVWGVSEGKLLNEIREVYGSQVTVGKDPEIYNPAIIHPGSRDNITPLSAT